MATVLDRIDAVLSRGPDAFVDGCRLFENGYLPATNRAMAMKLFPDAANLTDEGKDDLFEVCHWLGDFGFSFPEWRFPCQSFGDRGSLLERAGYTKLHRPTDVLDALLPDPARDLFGVGFKECVHGTINEKPVFWYVELRRAYMVVSNPVVTVIVRNSSAYFGRDRLPHCAYVSFEPFEEAELESLCPADFDGNRKLLPIRDLLAHPSEIASDERVKRVAQALFRLSSERVLFHEWLLREGLGDLAEFVEARIVSGLSIPYFAAIYDNTRDAIGSVRCSRQPDIALVTALNAIAHSEKAHRQAYEILEPMLGPRAFLCRFVMTSGSKGDRPALPG